MNKPILATLLISFVAMAGVEASAQSNPSPVTSGASKKVSHSRKTTVSKKKVQSYVCPMHPEVTSTKPGTCPKCKMDLRLAKDEKNVADDNHTTPVTPEATARTSRSKMVIPDVEVLDQHGNELHFYTDLIKDKIVAINFIFTNCTTICPPLAATFARLQREMGDKVGKDVHLISISVDPLTDTPERLKAWGAKFKAGPGWTFVTGEKQEMDTLLTALGAAVSKREDHSPALIIGNDSKGVWTRTYGLAKISEIMGVIQNVMAGKMEETSRTTEVKP